MENREIMGITVIVQVSEGGVLRQWQQGWEKGPGKAFKQENSKTGLEEMENWEMMGITVIVQVSEGDVLRQWQQGWGKGLDDWIKM